MSHNMEFKKKQSHYDVFTMSHNTQARIDCLMMIFVDVGN